MINKSYFKILPVLAFLAISILAISVALAADLSGSKISGWISSSGSSGTILAPIDDAGGSMCRQVSNISGLSYFVPTRFLLEWNQFLLHLPAGVSVGPCDCPDGQYLDGSSNCVSCPAGSYCINSSQYYCSAGTYSSGGASSCLSCPSGYTSNEGASSCFTCSAGYYYNGSYCVAVFPGYYSPADDVNYYCCYAGYFGSSYYNSDGYCNGYCEAGTYSYSCDSSCTDCPSGTYNPYSGNSECYYCQPGTYSSGTGNISCSSCPDGYYCSGGEDMTACPAGQSSPAGSDSLSDCLAYACDDAGDCDDSNPCTDDYCNNGGTLAAACSYINNSSTADCTATFGTCAVTGTKTCSGGAYGSCIAVDPRTTNCSGRECGSDGCGGSCGSCDSNEQCDAYGTCVCAAGYLDCDSNGSCETIGTHCPQPCPAGTADGYDYDYLEHGDSQAVSKSVCYRLSGGYYTATATCNDGAVTISNQSSLTCNSGYAYTYGSWYQSTYGCYDVCVSNCSAGIVDGYSYSAMDHGDVQSVSRTISGGYCEANVTCMDGNVTTDDWYCSCYSGVYSEAADMCVECVSDSDCSDGYYCRLSDSPFYSCGPSEASVFSCQRKCWYFTETDENMIFRQGDEVIYQYGCNYNPIDDPRCGDVPTCPYGCQSGGSSPITIGTTGSGDQCYTTNWLGNKDWHNRAIYLCYHEDSYTRHWYGDACALTAGYTYQYGIVTADGACAYPDPQAYCGDYVCDYPDEDYYSCSYDCEYYCGDGICSPVEDYYSCYDDCY